VLDAKADTGKDILAFAVDLHPDGPHGVGFAVECGNGVRYLLDCCIGVTQLSLERVCLLSQGAVSARSHLLLLQQCRIGVAQLSLEQQIPLSARLSLCGADPSRLANGRLTLPSAQGVSLVSICP